MDRLINLMLYRFWCESTLICAGLIYNIAIALRIFKLCDCGYRFIICGVEEEEPCRGRRFEEEGEAVHRGSEAWPSLRVFISLVTRIRVTGKEGQNYCRMVSPAQKA